MRKFFGCLSLCGFFIVLGVGCGARSPQSSSQPPQAEPAATSGQSATASLEKPTDSECIKCHRDATSNIPRDFLAGKMGHNQVDCSDCHGSEHQTADDAARAALPTEEDCGGCHDERLEQYLAGKHAKGWVAMTDMPTTGIQPHPYIHDKKGCGGCHKIGVRDDASRASGPSSGNGSTATTPGDAVRRAANANTMVERPR